jgi:tripartite-type tricarboxylate transporter receptor subunit TctC
MLGRTGAALRYFHAPALVLVCLLFSVNLWGQDAWPSKPMRMILPFPPGGGTDILGRLIADRLSASLGQPVVTENRGGAGGNVGAEAAAKSAPDGYTLVLVAPSLAISPTLYSRLNYDPVKDLAPISLVATVPNVMVTQPSMPGELKEFIASVKAKPGALNFGSGGAGTSNHLAGELFNLVAGTKLVHIPYKGVNLAMQDVLSGNVHLVFIGIPRPRRTSRPASCVRSRWWRRSARARCPTCRPWRKPGCRTSRSRPGTASSPRRHAAQHHQPAERRAGKIMHAPELREKLAATGTEPLTSTPDEFSAYIRKEIAKWGDVIRKAGVKAD